MTKKGKSSDGQAVLATHRAATHEYFILARYEAGIVLTGTEVKSCRDGAINLKEAYARVADGEVWLHGAHISPYSQGNRENPDPVRTRKLLLHAKEIRKLAKETETGGMTLVPLKAYLKNGKVKIELGLAKGKKSHDKRESIKKKDALREIARARGSRQA